MLLCLIWLIGTMRYYSRSIFVDFRDTVVYQCSVDILDTSHIHQILISQKFHTPEDLIRTSPKSRPDLGARPDLDSHLDPISARSRPPALPPTRDQTAPAPSRTRTVLTDRPVARADLAFAPSEFATTDLAPNA